MKVLLMIFVTLLATTFTECQNPVERVIFCDEKFTVKTKRNYTNYSGCLIEKLNEFPES